MPNAPDVRLPLRFIVAGVLACVAGAACLVIRPDILAAYHYNQYVIAATHLFVLGWICSVVMGAMYQLVPVALQTNLYSERLARLHFWFHTIGFIGMVWMFWKWDMKQVGHFASALAFGVLLFAYNIGRTLLRVPRWSTVASAVASGVSWLCLTILVGLGIAASKSSYELTDSAGLWGPLISFLRDTAAWVGRFDQIAAMHAHAHLGGLGFFVVLLVGFSYRLIPMFTLSDVQKPRRAAASILLLNVGLLGAFLTILLRHPLKIAFTAIAIVGLVCYGMELRAMLIARKRRQLDWPLIQFLTAAAMLSLVSVLAIVLSWPGLPLTQLTGQLENLYGFLALVGVVSFAIVGMLYKILPFLVWYVAYSHLIGKQKLPALSDLYSHVLLKTGFWSYLLSLLIICFGIVLSNPTACRAGSILLLLSFSLFAINVGLILSCLWRSAHRGLSASPSTLPPLAIHPSNPQ